VGLPTIRKGHKHQQIFIDLFVNSTMASEEPLFDPSLKKRKKKKVDFFEDPLGAEADPTKPAPETIESTTVNGERVDLGPTTAHEMMSEAKSEKKGKEEEDYKAMFGDMKKKKKKKDIRLDFVSLPESCFLTLHSYSFDRERVPGHQPQSVLRNLRAVLPPRDPQLLQMTSISPT